MWLNVGEGKGRGREMALVAVWKRGRSDRRTREPIERRGIWDEGGRVGNRRWASPSSRAELCLATSSATAASGLAIAIVLGGRTRTS